MKILAIDTTTVACSVALMIDDHMEEIYQEAPRMHTHLILPMIDQLLREAELDLSQLDVLACTLGPGSFTGVRIGVGVAQGLAYGADLPVVGISSLAVLAQSAYRTHDAQYVLPALDAKMEEVYMGHYEINPAGVAVSLRGDAVLKPHAYRDAPATDDHGWVGIGSGWDVYREVLQGPEVQRVIPKTHPHAQDMLPIAIPQYQANQILDSQDLQPIYLRKVFS